MAAKHAIFINMVDKVKDSLTANLYDKILSKTKTLIEV